MYLRKLTLFLAALALFVSAPNPAAAQNANDLGVLPGALSDDEIVDIIPAASVPDQPLEIHDDDVTHPPLRLTPDKSEIIRLDGDAYSVIIGNPAHVSILAENQNTLVAVPLELGATYMAVLDFNRNVIMQRHVIVGNPRESYVRVRNTCAFSGAGDCNDMEVYYCPGMCHSIRLTEDGIAASNAATGGSAPSEESAGGAAQQAATSASGLVTPEPVSPPP